MNKVIILLFILSVTVFAQNPSVRHIKNSGQYFYGEGSAVSEQDALDLALGALSKNISIIITTDGDYRVKETNSDINESFSKNVRTRSHAVITNYEKSGGLVNGKYEVFVYIDKIKFFESRKKLICDIYKKACGYETVLNLSDALKNYYFAIILMNSIPEYDLTFEGKNLVTEIPSKITNILNKTEFTLKSDRKKADKERELVFKVSCSGKPVEQIDFTFNNGTNNASEGRCSNGECIVLLYGGNVSFDRVAIDIKYSYDESRNDIAAVGDLWDLVKKPEFKFFTKQIGLVLPKENPPAKDTHAGKKDFYAKNGSYKLNLAYDNSCNAAEEIAEETLNFLEILKRSSIPEIEKYFSDDSFLRDKVSRIVKYNSPAIVGDSVYAEVNKTLTGWELRKIRVLNRYKGIKKQSAENIILDFNNEGRLDDITFSVLENVYNDARKQAEYGKDWINRQTIIKFVEKYRTSFLCRDLNTIDSLFADEALIIVGRIIKKATVTDGYRYLPTAGSEQPDAKYIKYTKDEYLNTLSKLFKKNNDIYIAHSSMDIQTKNSQKLYGISMRQNYYTNNYSDEGYLFLLIDFEHEHPQIYVRTWQPKEWDEQALIKLTNFELVRLKK